jgi:hypothetical protein
MSTPPVWDIRALLPTKMGWQDVCLIDGQSLTINPERSMKLSQPAFALFLSIGFLNCGAEPTELISSTLEVDAEEYGAIDIYSNQQESQLQRGSMSGDEGGESIGRDLFDDGEGNCCDACFAAAKLAGEKPGGKVCCCDDDGDGEVEPKACSFADKYPEEWPPGDGQNALNDCIHQHEQAHVDEGEGTCVGVAAGKPSVWEEGQDADECELNQYQDEIECLEGKATHSDGGTTYPDLVEERIKQLEDLLAKNGQCSEHCESP